MATGTTRSSRQKNKNESVILLQFLIGGLRAETLAYLEKKAAELKSKGLDKVSVVAKEGLPADEIISIARPIPDNLIAMCTHGRAGVTRWMLGSVTETVVRHSGGPVLVLRSGS